jgi:hypothetical protein
MAYEGQQPLKVIGAVAGADLSADTTQFKWVKFSTTNTQRVVLCSATTDVPCGVLQSPAPTSALDQPVIVVAVGETKLQDDGTCQVGNIIGPDANGRATPALATMYPSGKIVVPGGAAAAYATALVNCVAQTVHA